MIDSAWALVYATIGLVFATSLLFVATLIYAYHTRKQAKLLRLQISMQLFNFVSEHRFDEATERLIKFPEGYISTAKNLMRKLENLYKELGLD